MFVCLSNANCHKSPTNRPTNRVRRGVLQYGETEAHLGTVAGRNLFLLVSRKMWQLKIDYIVVA